MVVEDDAVQGYEWLVMMDTRHMVVLACKKTTPHRKTGC